MTAKGAAAAARAAGEGSGRGPWRAGPTLVDFVGHTPLLRLHRTEAREGFADTGIELYAKLEFMNPGGSVKDRAALQIVRDALAAGELGGQRRLLDSTSGNTGVAYAWIGAALGVPVTLVMPENVSTPRKLILAAHGVEVIYSDPLEGSDGAIRRVQQLQAEHPERYCYVDQYANESNPKAHFEGTGREIWAATAGRVTHFVAGLGTSGTLMGVSRRLKRENPEVQVLGVQPSDAFHGLEGLKYLPTAIVPPIFHADQIDRMLFIETDEGWDAAERLGREEGTLVGHSSGAAMAGVLRLARELRAAGRSAVIVTIFCDKAERYLEPQRK